eukprot:c15300_g1_i1 orf=189-485(-)
MKKVKKHITNFVLLSLCSSVFFFKRKHFITKEKTLQSRGKKPYYPRRQQKTKYKGERILHPLQNQPKRPTQNPKYNMGEQAQSPAQGQSKANQPIPDL